MMSSSFSRVLYYFPWNLILSLLLAFIFATIGIVIYKKATQGEPLIDRKDYAPFLKKWGAFFSRFGLWSSNPLNQSFDKALKVLHTFIGGTQYRYRLPWMVMLGAASSGKTTLLQSLELDTYIDPIKSDEPDVEKLPCNWWFYDHGIVLDVNGKFVIEPDKVASDEDSWSLFLNLLAHYRPKRALDGIVLTLPVTEFSGKTAYSHDDLALRANYLYEKLWQVQRMTGLRVPVYIVITQCDFLPGFESFCKALPERTKFDMFGWSNDKDLNSVYASSWVDEAFSSINTSLNRIQEEIYAEGVNLEGRDGIFLFPLSFNQLKDGLKTYLDNLFRSSDYHESFFLRGIYFTGDSHIEKPGERISSVLEMPWRFTEKTEKENRNLYFIRDLFETKIFREFGLARPISKVLLGNTTAIRLSKVIMAVLIVAGTLGLLHANERLQETKINFLSILPQIEVTLEKIHGQSDTTDIGRLYFDQQAQTILTAMTRINVTTLFSPFLPPSWISRLNDKIRDVMVLVYERVIFRSMGSQLNHKARRLVDLNTPIAVSEQPGNGINPLETMEFYKLKHYLLSLQALELAATTFNSLGPKSSLKDVSDIIKYLFNYDMPSSFYENDYYYLTALEKTNVQLFDFGIYRNNAAAKLYKLSDEFSVAAFDPDTILPGLAQLSNALSQFTGVRNYTAYDSQMLRDVYVGLQESVASISNPGFLWLNSQRFNPGPQYEHVIRLIINSSFFTDSLATQLTARMNGEFLNFRKQLGAYTSPLFEKGLFATQNDLAIPKPSEEALTLLTNLQSFFGETFMNPIAPKNILTNTPVGTILLWDTLRLQTAVGLLKKYNEFVDSRLLNMPKSLQPLLQKVGRETFTQNLTSVISNAQVFSTEQSVGGTITSPEDALLSQIQNYRASTPYLEPLLLALQENGANTAFVSLKNLLTSQAYAPLGKLDSILMEESPYALKMESFEWWKGEAAPAFEAFGVGNMMELKHYLAVQRDRINYLAQEFAKPLVSLLENINKEGLPSTLPLLAKWQGIITAFSEYGHKAPGNSIAELESFILTTLYKVSLKSCPHYCEMMTKLWDTDDFFISILVSMQEKLQEQCFALEGHTSICTYTKLADFFNTNLAGRFPFAKKSDVSSPDADPDDIHAFFQMMDPQQATDMKKVLKRATDLGPSGKSAYTFVEQMDTLRNFFGGFVAEKHPLPAPAFTYDVTFRVDRSQESHGNEVLDWTLTTHDIVISMRSPSHKGYWTIGDPIQVSFKWATNSPLQPTEAQTIPNFSVQGESATYSYQGTWALLRLLQQHQIVMCEGGKKAQKKEQDILQFRIPLTATIPLPGKKADSPEEAIVYLGIELSPMVKSIDPTAIPKGDTAECTPGAAEKLQEKLPTGQPMEMPSFPTYAPELKHLGAHHVS